MAITQAEAERQKEIKQAEELFLGGPEVLGFTKGLFLGRFVSDWVMPYPRMPAAQQTELPLKEIPEMEKKALNRPVADLAQDGDKDLIDISVTSSTEVTVGMNGNSHADRVKEALGSMFMDIICSVCGSEKVIRAGACGVCTECGTSQGCS